MIKLAAALSLLLSSVALQADEILPYETDHLMRYSASSHSYSHSHSQKSKKTCRPGGTGPQGLPGPVGNDGPVGPSLAPNNIFVYNDVNQTISSFPTLLNFDEAVEGPDSTISLVSPGTIALPANPGTYLVSVNLIGEFSSDNNDIAEFQLLLNGSPVGLPLISSVIPQHSFIISYQTIINDTIGGSAIQIRLTTTAGGTPLTLLSNLTEGAISITGGIAGVTVVEIE